ncbi:MAG: hypothetical protein AB8G99_02535, partial [Planctomycetaceae bacterium]
YSSCGSRKMNIFKKALLCVALTGIVAPLSAMADGSAAQQTNTIECWKRYKKFKTLCAAKDAARKLRELDFDTRITASDCGCFYFVDYRH